MTQEELDKAAREAVRKLQEQRGQWIPMLEEVGSYCEDNQVPAYALDLMRRLITYASTAEAAAIALVKAHIKDLKRRSASLN